MWITCYRSQKPLKPSETQQNFVSHSIIPPIQNRGGRSCGTKAQWKKQANGMREDALKAAVNDHLQGGTLQMAALHQAVELFNGDVPIIVDEHKQDSDAGNDSSEEDEGRSHGIGSKHHSLSFARYTWSRKHPKTSET
ncbi:hypothetical protein BT96DRAFT_991465 [Gymnopus androsaceus JB14]|uniref:Uncharacterized protein n=1 Tax=Gymnopus androsaceus JB14 TaxID=1447944 RepID=A0A6A4HV88_9AGAR|nr:hypothetical protein BT96DRAFT_991465 [Gymnopus androsaceus JB14]